VASRYSLACLLTCIAWNNRGQPETPAWRRSRVVLLRSLPVFQPIAVLAAAAARYWGQRQRARSYPQISRTPLRESAEVQNRSGSYGCPVQRGAEPSALEYSSDSFRTNEPLNCPAEECSIRLDGRRNFKNSCGLYRVVFQNLSTLFEHTVNAGQNVSRIVDNRRYPTGRLHPGKRNLTWKSKNQSPTLPDPFLSH
jgi:hypothetical protein